MSFEQEQGKVVRYRGPRRDVDGVAAAAGWAPGSTAVQRAILLATAVAAAALLAGGCRTVGMVEEDAATARAERQVAPAGRQVTDDRPAPGVERVHVRGVRTIIDAGPEAGPRVVVSGDAALVAVIETFIEDGDLRIEVAPRVEVDLRDVTVRVGAPGLREVQAVALADVSVSGWRVDDAVAQASSGAELVLSGEAEQLMLDAASGAVIDARGMRARRARVEGRSGAQLDVHATEDLEGRLSSGSHGCYEGDPRRRFLKTTSGGSMNACGG